MFFKFIQKSFVVFAFTASSMFADAPLNQKTLFTAAIGSIGQSNFIHACSENVQKKIDAALTPVIFKLGNESASEKYLQLGIEAQHALGIPLERHLPIKKIDQTSPVAHLFGAIAESDAIYVNEEKFDKVTFGATRCAIFHEAVHVKYHDKCMDQAIDVVSLLGASIATFLVLKSFNVVDLRKTYSMIAGLGALTWGSYSYHHFMERRADIEGHYATQCSVCVREHAARRKQLFEVECHCCKDNGYLWAADLEKIAQDLGDATCAYHSEQLTA